MRRIFLPALVLALLASACSARAAGTTSVPDASRTASSAAPSSAAPSAAAAPTPKRLIDHVRWARTDKGAQLQVFPTAAGRSAPDGDGDTAWKQVLADAPNADTAGMEDQFLCHWEFARIADPDKPSWNLEPWRPAVGWLQTVAAECNPGGAEG